MSRRVVTGAEVDDLGSPRFVSARFDPVVLYVTPEQARLLERSVPALVGSARRQLAARRARNGRAVVLDLSELPSVPPIQPLLRLIEALRLACGPEPAIALTAASNGLAAELSARGLPDKVVVTDRSGRHWPTVTPAQASRSAPLGVGRPTRRPIGSLARSPGRPGRPAR